MKEFFKEVFEYHTHFNQLLLEQLQKYEAQLPQRTYPLFCHILNAHQIWNARILNETAIGVMDIHSFEESRDLDHTNYKTTLKILDSVSLNEIVTYTNSKQKQFNNNVRDILFHAANHAAHHKGQIVSDFRLAGIEPIVTDYIFYKR